VTGGGPAFVPALAEALVQARISDTARAVARASMLDTAACISAGWMAPQAVGVRRAHLCSGAAGAGAVALALGTAAHALDYDDYEEPGSTHPSAVLVPVILGLARQRDVTLGQAEKAYVLGYSAILAAGISMRYGHYMAGWHATSTIGSLGAAVCAGALLELDTARMGHAASLAMTQAAGLKAQFGFDAKAVHAGLAARNGIDAACLSAGGVSAAPGLYEGPSGFAALYGGAGQPFDGLPEVEAYPPWRKLSPSCGYTLRAIDAACELAGSGLVAKEIAKVRIEIADAYAKVAPYRAPKTPAEARFSVAWCVAAGLIDGHVGVDHFDDVALARQDLRALEARVEIDLYPLPEGAGDMASDAPDRVVVQLCDGDVMQSVCAVPRGAPDRALSEAQFMAKLLECGLEVDAVERFFAAVGGQVLRLDSLMPEHVLEGF